MAETVPYIFCTYDFVRKKMSLSGDEQLELLNQLKAQKVAYRTKDPTPDQRDTFEMKPRRFNFKKATALSWCVGYDLHHRIEAEYDFARDEIDEYSAEAKGIKFTRFVAIPSLRALAVNDQHGDIHLGGMAGISRFKSVVRSIRGNRLRVELAGSTPDIDRAFKNWQVQEFSFSVRPFNPTRKRLGGKLHDLMLKNGVSQLSGVAKPTDGKAISDPKSGIVGEAIGLADEGYGQVAVNGITQGGREATLGKPHFSQEKTKNISRQAKPRVLKVYIEDVRRSERAQVEEVVKALLEFYEPNA